MTRIQPYPSRETSEQSATDRIRILAAQGLKIRDISSSLHIHPLIVIRVLNDSDVDSYQNGESIRKLGVGSADDQSVDPK